jgi:hypothetical protein
VHGTDLLSSDSPGIARPVTGRILAFLERYANG